MLTDLRLCELCAEAYTEPATVETAGVHLRITQEDGYTVCAFRGTHSAPDLLRDLAAVSWHSSEFGEIHAGFWFDALEAWPRIPHAANMILTGHSKGGADAQLIAALFANAGFPPVRLVTFGTPHLCRFKSDRVCGLLAAVAGTDYRHGADPIPLVPVGFVPAREVVQIGERSRLPKIEDHFIQAYLDAMQAMEVAA